MADDSAAVALTTSLSIRFEALQNRVRNLEEWRAATSAATQEIALPGVGRLKLPVAIGLGSLFVMLAGIPIKHHLDFVAALADRVGRLEHQLAAHEVMTRRALIDGFRCQERCGRDGECFARCMEPSP